jgi:cobalt-precorrin-5B (C1)-methyltransferase
LVLGHPGKLAKLAAGQWNTHSSRSRSATGYLAELHGQVLGGAPPDSLTTEGMFAVLGSKPRRSLGDALAQRIRLAVAKRVRQAAAVVLVNMAGEILGADGDLSPWQ